MGKSYSEQSKTYQNQQEILGGKAYIYTTKQSGGNYYVRSWVADQKYYFRQSLRTTDKANAIKKAETVIFDLYAKVQGGYSIRGLSWGKLCDNWLEFQLERVHTKRITLGRYNTIKTQVNKHIKHLVKDGKNTKLSDIEPRDFRSFAHERRLNAKSSSRTKSVQDVTIRNEYTTIASIVRYGFDNRELNFSHILKEEIKIKGDAINRRETFDDIDEYNKFTKQFRPFIVRAKNDRDKYYRELFRDYCLISAHSFARPGELRNLKWEMVEVQSSGKFLPGGSEVKALILTLPSEICKNRKSRVVMSKGGHFIERLKTYTSFHNPKDFVFHRYGNCKPLSKSQFHRIWHQFITERGFTEKDIGKRLTYYGFRHWGITGRLYSGMDVYQVSKLAGTSVQFIEQFYEHMDMKKLMDSALKDVHRDKNGNIIMD